jgi:hypothetical protein
LTGRHGTASEMNFTDYGEKAEVRMASEEEIVDPAHLRA